MAERTVPSVSRMRKPPYRCFADRSTRILSMDLCELGPHFKIVKQWVTGGLVEVRAHYASGINMGSGNVLCAQHLGEF